MSQEARLAIYFIITSQGTRLVNSYNINIACIFQPSSSKTVNMNQLIIHRKKTTIKMRKIYRHSLFFYI